MRLALLLTLCALPACALADDFIYTWRDKAGQVHYADTPPAGVPDVRKIRRSGSPAEAAAARKDLANKELEIRKQQTEAGETQKKAGEQAKEAEIRRQNCEQARAQIAAIESGQRLVRYTASGEPEFLDDAQRAAELSRAKQAEANWCR